MTITCTLSRRFQPRFGSIAIVLQAWQQIHTAGSIRSSNLEPSISAINGMRDDVSQNQSSCLPKESTLSMSPRVNATLSSIVTGENSSPASSVADSNGRPTDDEQGIRHTVMEFLNQFMQGTKLLWTELGQARKTAGRKKAGEVVTFHEDRILRQVGSDFAMKIICSSNLYATLDWTVTYQISETAVSHFFRTTISSSKV